MYRLIFHTAEYFKSRNVESFYPEVPVIGYGVERQSLVPRAR
jgi:5-hydroxyisourate hydrolase-like protein (transthyretin family)